MTRQCLPTQSQQGPGHGNGDSRRDWWHKGTWNCLVWSAQGFPGRPQSYERTGRDWALRAPTAGWWLSPVPRAAGTNPRRHGISSSPRNLNSPEAELALAGRGTRTPRTRNQSFYCTKTPHTVLDVLGSWARSSVGTLGCSISVCSLPPPTKMKSGWECCKPDHCALDYSPRRD